MRSAPQSTGVKGGLALSDGFASFLSGLGTSVDKNVANRYGYGAGFCASHTDAEAAYRTSWIVRKAHDLPPFDMTREWRRWQADDVQIQAIEDEEKRLGLKAKVRMALLYARLYGGGALILGAKARLGALDQPLDASRMVKGDLEFVHVVNRHQLNYDDLQRDATKPGFGEPVMWTMSGGSNPARIHPSRVIPFIGQPVPAGAIGGDLFWGDPLLTSIWDAVTNADLVQAGISALVQEAKVDTLKVPGFSTNMATAEYEAIFLRRVNFANKVKSILNTRLIDAEEEWDTQQVSFANLADIERQKLMIVAAACDIPATRFLGESPKGMNATGQGSQDDYISSISSKQENELQPTLEPILDEALIRSALGSRPENVSYLWAPLAEVEPKEASEIELNEAKTAQIYATEKLVPPDALAKSVQNRLMESGRWPGLEQAIEETENELDFDEVTEPGAAPANEDDPSAMTQPPKRQAAKDAAPRTLYVRRDVLNHAEITAWAKGQGFKTTLGEKMHVTVLYSKVAVDWLKMGEAWTNNATGGMTILPGGPRVVEPLGDGGAIVLLFSSMDLSWRHKGMIDLGASSDFPDFTPHTTITWDLADVDLDKVEPYRGPIVLGPEIFEEIKPDWQAGLVEDAKPMES